MLGVTFSVPLPSPIHALDFGFPLSLLAATLFRELKPHRKFAPFNSLYELLLKSGLKETRHPMAIVQRTTTGRRELQIFPF